MPAFVHGSQLFNMRSDLDHKASGNAFGRG